MKKFTVAILAFLYMASTSGATVHFHYCMGKLVDAGFTSKEKQRCSKCGMLKSKSPKPCCKDVQKFVKLEQGHEQPAVAFVPAITGLTPAPVQSAVSAILLQGEVTAYRPNGPPPGLYQVPLFVLYRNFRI